MRGRLLVPLVALALGATVAREAAAIAEVVVPRVTTPPRIEEFAGMEPGASLAGTMAVVDGGFLQRVPADDAPSTQRTVVYLAYDDEHLYAVFVAFDTEPGKVRAHLTRRESFFGDDIVHIMLDTFLDRRRAYSFICNPLGVQFDAVWTEGQEFDDSFDTLWSSEGRLTDRGYVVRMAIPFKSLRFPRAPDQRWGILLNRDIPRENEETFWPRYTQKIQGRLNQMGVLSGIGRVSPGRNVQFIPYASARKLRAVSGGTSQDPSYDVEPGEVDVGVDAKAVFRDSLVLDATLNPDFSQVESDAPQVTVNRRFEVYFPEKRPFFLENAGYFATPIDLVFTRRIVDPRAGARLTGKAGGFALGAFVIDDRAPGESVGERARFGIVRVNRDVSDQSTLGVLYTQRDFASGSNRVGAIDGRFRLGDHWTASLQEAGSRTIDPDGAHVDGSAWYGAIERTGEHLSASFTYEDLSPGFRTETGFVPRVDIREARAYGEYVFRPSGPALLSWGPALDAARNEDHDGLRLDEYLRPEIFFEWRGPTRLQAVTKVGHERLRPVDFPALAEPRDFPLLEKRLFFETERWAWLTLDAELAWGHGTNYAPPAGEEPHPADWVSGLLSAAFRPTASLRIEPSWLWLRLTERDGEREILSNDIVRLRAHYQVTPRLSLRVIARYDRSEADPLLTSVESGDNVNGDFLLTYLVNPWTALYVGYNANRARPARGPDDLPLPGDPAWVDDSRQAFVKFSYLIRL